MTNMASMFYEAEAFNQPLNWNTSKVTNMSSMFFRASSFNQDLSNWNVKDVEDMKYMFAEAKRFNNGDKPLRWTWFGADMACMFENAIRFNQDLSNWDVVGRAYGFNHEDIFRGAVVMVDQYKPELFRYRKPSDDEPSSDE